MTGSDSVTSVAASASAGSESVARTLTGWLGTSHRRRTRSPVAAWIQPTSSFGHGLLFHEALHEFYAEAVNDAGWAPAVEPGGQTPRSHLHRWPQAVHLGDDTYWPDEAASLLPDTGAELSRVSVRSRQINSPPEFTVPTAKFNSMMMGLV